MSRLEAKNLGLIRAKVRKLSKNPLVVRIKSLVPYNPLDFAKELKLWLADYQKNLIRTIWGNKNTLVKGCHTSGKTFVFAFLAWHWVLSRPNSGVILCSPTMRQVKNNLFREVRALKNLFKFPAVVLRTEVRKDDEAVMMAYAPKDGESAVGMHMENLLAFGDEAQGLHHDVWEALLSMVSNIMSKFVGGGNPITLGNRFHRNFKDKDSPYAKYTISAFDTPNFTGEYAPNYAKRRLLEVAYAERIAKEYGKDHPEYITRVLGEFAEINEHSFIPLAWVDNARGKILATERGYVTIFGFDVGGVESGNQLVQNASNRIEIITDDYVVHETDADILAAWAFSKMEIYSSKNPEQLCIMFVDAFGPGAEVFGKLTPLVKDIDNMYVLGINMYNKNIEPFNNIEFHDLRAKLAYFIRLDLSNDVVSLPIDEDLHVQLVNIRTEPEGTATYIKLEPKKKMAERIGESPDKYDAYSFTRHPIPAQLQEIIEYHIGAMALKKKGGA